jgi:uncharacterized membrane protein (UPF0127 family)
VPWIISDDIVMASAEVASTGASRRRGLLGRDHLDGAFVLEKCRWIHTVGMRFPLDVAYLDERGTVIKTMLMRRNRVGAPVWHARSIIEAEAGAFGRWGLHVGLQIELRCE